MAFKASAIVLRGAKGYSWYYKQVQAGDKAFRRYAPPTPFDWAAPPLNIPTSATGDNSSSSSSRQSNSGDAKRPKVFFDVVVDKQSVGRVVFELAADILPITSQNFMNLCGGAYKGAKISQIMKNSCIMGGSRDAEGLGNHSSFKERHFQDENFVIPHSGRGLLGMASVGIHTNGSAFYVSLGANPHMNGRCVNFGRVVEGDSVLKELEGMYTFRQVPIKEVLIADCGVLGTENSSSSSRAERVEK